MPWCSLKKKKIKCVPLGSRSSFAAEDCQPGPFHLQLQLPKMLPGSITLQTLQRSPAGLLQ